MPSAARAEEPVPAKAAPAWGRVSEYRVKEGDTLWQIAERVRVDRGLGTEQVVLAIYRNNRDAFFGNNVSNLKAGKILRMPEREEIESVSQPLARREFRAQYDVWLEYKLKLAGATRTVKVAEAAPEAAKPIAPAPVPAPAPAVPDQGVAPPAKGAAPEELLKIVRANIDAQKGTPDKKVAEAESAKDAGGRERQALAERVTTLEETLLSRQLEQRDMSEKIGQVRNLLTQESRLLEIESRKLAEAQQAQKPAPAPAPPPATTEVAKAEPPKPAAAPPKAAPVPPPAAVEKVPAPRPRPAPPAPAPAEKGVIESFLDSVGDLLMPVLVAAIVIVGGVIGLVWVRRRKKSIAEFEESILTSEAVSTTGAASTSSDTGSVQSQSVSAGDTSFLSDFSQGTGAGAMHTDDVDPIAEAEVYLAYGRDETAEEILKDAIVKHPQREELKVKLLEIYHQRNDVNAFETLAEEYYAQLGGRPGKHWSKVEEMGRKLNPDNPMFRGGAPAKGAAAASAVTASVTAAPTPAPAVDFGLAAATAPAPAASGLDFDIGQTQPPVEPAVTSGTTIDFEHSPAAPAGGLESLDLGQAVENVVEFEAAAAPPAAAPEEPVAAPSAADTGISWDFDAGSEAVVAEAPPVAAAAAAPASAQWDETATKLDLAKAYIDMGDAEGARSILNEVMTEGNDAQKRQAKELAAQIG
jgi:pilus assembly protein FimV